MYTLPCQHLGRVYRTEIRLLQQCLVHYSRWVTLVGNNFVLESVGSAVAVVVVVGIGELLYVDEDLRRRNEGAY